MDNEDTIITPGLDGFQGWEEISDEKDFFTQDSTAEVEDATSKESTEEEEEEDDEIEKDLKKVTAKKTKESNFFEQSDEEDADNDDGESNDGEGDKQTGATHISTLNFLKEKGLLEYELDEGEELTEAKAEELMESNYDSAVESRIDELFEDVPQIVKQLNSYVLKGGDVGEFLKQMSSSSTSSITDDMDLTVEDNQITVVREMLKGEEDEETIEAQIDFLKDSGKLEAFSKSKHNKWKTNKDATAARLTNTQIENARQEKLDIKEAKNKVSDFLSENKSIGPINFNKMDIKELPSYMNDKTVKLKNGGAVSELQAQLFYELPKNKSAMLQLASLMRSRNKDGTFNFDSIVKTGNTELSKEVRENLRRSGNAPGRSGSGKSFNNKKRSLADIMG
tara:strand:- start:6810 stop:7991 length:1182 start_codon:yes stop_codon:yes gene_type:complete